MATCLSVLMSSMRASARDKSNEGEREGQSTFSLMRKERRQSLAMVERDEAEQGRKVREESMSSNEPFET